MSENKNKKHQLPKLLRSRVPYTVCIVLFSLLLAAVIAVRVLVPAAVSFPGNVTATDFSSFEMPSGDFDTSSMPSGDFDTSSMPSGDFDTSSIPSGDFDTSEMPSMPSGGFDASGSSDSSADGTGGFTAQETQSFGFLSTVRSHWIVFAIIFAVLDIASVVLLILVSRKYPAEEEETSDRYVAKRPAAMWPAVVAVIAAIAVIIGLFPVSSASEDEISAVKEIVSGTVETGDVEDVLVTTGVLADDEGTDIEYPEAVELTARLVSNGDTVSAGDIIATADTASVMTAIEELQEQLNLLDESLQESSDDEVSAKLTSTVSGRVKEIYAEKGTDVIDTMNEYGCLMRISLDGCMAVDIDAGTLTTGESVTVTLSDGTELNGKVSEINAGTAVITVSDKSADIGEAVTVTDDGAELGSGSLYIHSELLVTGYSGTVSSVSVSEDEKIDDGDTLLKLKNVAYTAVYDSLLSQREDLVEDLNTLFAIEQTGYITAESDGVISGIDEDLPLVTNTAPAQTATASTTPVTYSTMPVTAYAEAGFGGAVENPDQNEQQGGQQGEGGTSAAETPAVTGNFWIAKITSINVENGVCTVYISYVSSTDATAENAAAEYAAGTPTKVPFDLNYSGELNVGSYLIIDADTMTVKETVAGATTTGGGTGGTDIDDILKSLGGGSGGGYSLTTTTSSDEDEEEESYSGYEVEKTVLCTITPQDTMTIEVPIDELDILTVSSGTEVTVLLDAFSGQSFEGTITGIDSTGTNSGGNTKYTATVTIDRADGMLAGMNASVRITRSADYDTLIIPVAALNEENGSVFVYTGYDEKKDTLTDPVEVTTGLSDGDNAEILSGLEAGDTYYYSYADTVVYNAAS